MQSVEDLRPYLEDLKISAFRKAKLIKNDVHNVTIGPNSSSPKPRQMPTTSISPARKFSHRKDAAKFSVSDEILPFRQIEKEYELERQQQVREAIESHAKKFELFEAQQNENRKQQWLIQQQKSMQSMQHQKNEIMLALKRYEDSKASDNEKLLSYYKELEETRKQSAAVLEAKKRERELLKKCLDNQGIFHSIYQEIMMLIKNCQDENLKSELTTVWKECKELNDLMTGLISKCKTTHISIDELKTAEAIIRTATQLKNNINETLFKNEQIRKQEEIRQEAEKNQALLTESSIIQTTIADVPVRNTPPEKAKEVRVSSILDKCVSKSNFKWYSEITAFSENYMESFKELSEDDRFKQFKFDCKKAINLTVNAISAVNAQHLRDKHVKLSNLLRGQAVVIGDFQMSASKHPKGIPFCIDMLAKKFVFQGDLMISSNPEAAFSYATIIVSLWNEFPDFGKILLAYFFKECPYLVPIYIPRAVDQTDQDFYKTQGYRYIDGQIEKQDKFIKRMTGIMRLYFAILISAPKQGLQGNPHNLKVAWTWFVSVLKLEPRIEITATMLHIFFEIVGFEMQNTYRAQFFKLLRFFVEHYIPSLKKIDSGGPVNRLESVIQQFKENRNQFKPPNGILSKNFW